MAGQHRVQCDLCKRLPGDPHKGNCARSKFAQARLSALCASSLAPRWLHVSTMFVSDTEIESIGEHTIPAGAPRSDTAREAFFLLPGDTYSRYPGRGGRPRNPKVARFAVVIPRRRAA